MVVKISVIIVAHDRRIFLPYAVESVLHQSLQRDSYEILVVKHFTDHEFDKYLTGQGIKVIITDAESLGSKLVLGIIHSNGDIVSFLEDDDVFLENKLENVINNFSDHFLVYYHNNFSVINDQGSVLEVSMPYFQKSRGNKKLRINTNEIKLKTIIKLDREGGFFNLSCISVRRSLVTGILDSFRGINVAMDNFLFYLALDSGQRCLIDSEVFTQYRIHDLNSSLSAIADKDKFFANKLDFFKMDLVGFRAIHSLSKNDVVEKYLSCRTLIPEIWISLLSYKKADVTEILNALLCSIRIRSVNLFVSAVMYASTRFFSNLALLFLYNYEMCKINKINKS